MNYSILNISSLLDKRRESIEDFLQNIHLFTKKDLELEKNTLESETEIVDNIIRKHLIDKITTEAQMVQEYQIYLIMKGHSNNYIKYVTDSFLAYIHAFNDDQDLDL
jgi:hypothetical protein